MKSKFSKYWIGSKQPRKQRKYVYNAPLHLKSKFLSANLSKELRKKYLVRSMPLRKDDEVIVMRGKFAKKKGKVLKVYLKKTKITVEGVNKKKSEGSIVNIPLHPSNVKIVSLKLEDKRRLKKQKVEEKNVPEKKQSK
jgi:large subunit ribosomal protein L24